MLHPLGQTTATLMLGANIHTDVGGAICRVLHSLRILQGGLHGGEVVSTVGSQQEKVVGSIPAFLCGLHVFPAWVLSGALAPPTVTWGYLETL